MRPYTLAIICLALFSCKKDESNHQQIFGTSDLNQMNRRLLEIAMEDGFPPPIASRVYVYPHIAHYITIQKFYPDSLASIAGKVNGLNPVGDFGIQNAHPQLTALLAFCKTAKKVVFSEHLVDEMEGVVLSKAENAGLSPAVIEASDICSDEITRHIAAWISKDNYVETRTMDRWTSTKKPGQWIETPPDYGVGLEPHWIKIRPLVIDSANIYKSTPPPSFDPSRESAFYKMVNAVYEESKVLDEEKTEIALYWDDNPNTSEHIGHLMTIIHKISPPGHWLDIISQINRKENASLFKATKAYTYSSIAMFDAIISCWYEKYSTNLIRPITYIQANIDVEWTPLIQTPPFPEYTSGHSAISAAAATILTDIYGEPYAFSDSTEVLFGQPVRNFNSFQEAAWEVSLSRFYAGIHYMEGVVEGNKQGKYIGEVVLDALQEP